MSVAAGTVIAGRYEILDRVAEGGMSSVYRARRRDDGRVVALKILRPQYAADREFIERFVREAGAAETLRHPNIVRVYESGRDGDTYFIAMEYVEGTDLKGHLQRVGRLLPDDAERIALAVCDALDYAHKAGIIHRDVKPQNILLASDGTVKVTDFGIARALAAVTITQPGTVLGTVQYLSPEQARGAPVGRASDLYGLGAVLYEMLTGRLPYAGETPIAIAMKHLHEPPPRARDAQPDVPVRLDAIVVKAMAKRPEDRYASAREMADDLSGKTARWREAVEDEAVTRQFQLDPPVAGRRDGGLAVRVGAAVAVMLVVGIWLAVRAVNAYLTVPEVEMPSVVGKTLAEAERLVRDAGLVLEVGDRVHSASVPPDIVVSQDQPPGKRLKQGRRVTVVVSMGIRTVTVPSLIQRSLQEAQLALDAADLRVGALQDGYDDVIKPGYVLRQDPAPGAQVAAGSPVVLVISRGPPLVEMPQIAGRPLGEARALLEERGLVITHVRTVGVEGVQPGTVLEQTPAAGTKVRPGQVVIALTVSARPGEEAAPPAAPVITAEPQPVATPGPPAAQPRPAPRPDAPGSDAPGADAPRRGAAGPAAGPSVPPGPGAVKRTRIQVVVPEGGPQEVRIVVIDENGVNTVYQAPHAPGDRIDQVVRSQGYTIIQVYIANRLVQEVRP